jgi:predicted Zn-dependent protease
MQRAEFDARFQQAIVMLHARQYEHAATALHRLIEIDPRVPEVHVNMGFALLGLKRHAAARDFFVGAMDLRPEQANAYYGLAIALEALDDRAGALGAMRTFVHLATADDPWLPKARAALWEWQAQSPK